MRCRHCGCDLKLPFIDLGSAPPSNAYLSKGALHEPETWYPLRVLVCEKCWLVQTEDFARADELFNSDYAYFSSFSSSWLDHCKRFVAETIDQFALSSQSLVVEVAANDGYLLQYFVQNDIPCLGIEPTASTAAAARAKQVPIIEEFFGADLVRKVRKDSGQADLIIANNVLAHVPDINDFLTGISSLLKPDGIATFEFPYLPRLVSENQFDTIYHEHFSYLSFTSIENVFEPNCLSVFDVKQLPTHGGSLRIYAQRKDLGERQISKRVIHIRSNENEIGISSAEYYAGFQEKANTVKNEFVRFLIEAKEKNKQVIGYGAAAKGNTLLNYAGIRPDLISFVVDKNPEKQYKYLPGSRIPIMSEERLKQVKPDYVVLLPWNLRDELMEQLAYIKEWGGKFVFAVPRLNIL